MIKNILWWMTLPFGIGVALVLVCLGWVGWLISAFVEICFLFLSRWEWWCANQHKNLEQPLNPFTTSIKDIISREE